MVSGITAWYPTSFNGLSQRVKGDKWYIRGMGIRSRICLAALLTAGIVSFASAKTDYTGVWHGHVKIDTSKLPPVTDPNQKKMMMDQIKSVELSTITLTLKKDHSFSLITDSKTRPAKPTTGTYSTTATTLSLQSGSTTAHQPPQTFTISKDGKSLSLSQGPARVTFVR